MTAARPIAAGLLERRRPYDGPIVVSGAHGQSLLLRVDAVPREGETVLARGFEEPEDGGKATNQAVACAKLGETVRLVTMIGDDDRGRRWRATLERYGIDMRFVLEKQGPTDVGFVMLPPSRIPAIASSCELSLALDGGAVRSVADAFAGAAIVICQLEAPQACARESFRLGREAGAVTILNPAPAGAIDPELLELTDVLVPNEHEAAALEGAEAEPPRLAESLATRFGCVVVVTAGAAGAFLAAPGQPAGHVRARAAEAADTTGAGDAFVGALASRLRAGEPLADAVAFAVDAATISVEREGTMPAYATTGEMDAGAGRPERR